MIGGTSSTSELFVSLSSSSPSRLLASLLRSYALSGSARELLRPPRLSCGSVEPVVGCVSRPELEPEAFRRASEVAYLPMPGIASHAFEKTGVASVGEYAGAAAPVIGGSSCGKLLLARPEDSCESDSGVPLSSHGKTALTSDGSGAFFMTPRYQSCVDSGGAGYDCGSAKRTLCLRLLGSSHMFS